MTEILRTSFNELRATAVGDAVPYLNKVGRGVLGVYAWRLLEELMRPMNSMHQSAWAKAMRRNPDQAIRDYAEVRGVPVSQDRSGDAQA